MKTSEVCIQFTGGKDSALLAALMAQRFERVHLLTFHNLLIVDLGLASLNVKKLEVMFGKNKISHTLIDNERLFRHLYAGRWFRDIRKYKTYAANNV